MEPVLIGYIAKKTVRPAPWLEGTVVEEICSVSNCISKPADGWDDELEWWDLAYHLNPERADRSIPQGERENYDLYAYRIYPVVFTDGKRTPFSVSKWDVVPLTESFERLGIDVVSRYGGNVLEHSPLSCNGMATKVAINRHCLVDELDQALEIPALFEAGKAEPGPYHLVEVWRLKK
jgi:hypothetical protein